MNKRIEPRSIAGAATVLSAAERQKSKTESKATGALANYLPAGRFCVVREGQGIVFGKLPGTASSSLGMVIGRTARSGIARGVLLSAAWPWFGVSLEFAS
jgi:hypothetical protein